MLQVRKKTRLKGSVLFIKLFKVYFHLLVLGGLINMMNEMFSPS